MSEYCVLCNGTEEIDGEPCACVENGFIEVFINHIPQGIFHCMQQDLLHLRDAETVCEFKPAKETGPTEVTEPQPAVNIVNHVDIKPEDLEPGSIEKVLEQNNIHIHKGNTDPAEIPPGEYKSKFPFQLVEDEQPVSDAWPSLQKITTGKTNRLVLFLIGITIGATVADLIFFKVF